MMPDFCAAYGCSNERNEKTKQKGITFHSFPSDKQRRQSWTIALRRGVRAKDRTVLCSCHFRPEDFDKSGQTDHQYALDPVKAKEKLAVSQESVEKLRWDLRNAKDRERRQKEDCGLLVGGFKKNKMLTEELEHKLKFYSDLPVELFKHPPCLHSCSKGICFNAAFAWT
ncbi:hypothetical protein UPYG_G00130160 [Umbra pygmaea]|uniref:THAP-type domain-containing protein n=1 Tax=Umbra pygmaea TaxID=75934 RepID=A0ABD0XM35_UMBPY